jgi:aromatic-L-amino-acid decarboxylase
MDPLDVSPSQFLELAGRTIELLGDHLEGLDEIRSFPVTSGAETEQLFGGPIPEQGMRAAALDLLPGVLRHSCPRSPRFFGYVLGAGDPVASLGDLVASVLNQNVTAWRSSPAAVTIERSLVRWLASALGAPGFSGSLTSGGSSANLMALAMARESTHPANESGARPGMVYASTEVHMSIPKAMALLGLGRDHVRLIPVDASYRMIPEELERAIIEDHGAGRRQVAVVATAGTVNTGAVDPLEEIGAISRRAGLWFHIDGAYGGLAALAIPEQFAGLAGADSLSLDPHKWLSQPVDCGCLLYRDRAAAQKAFAFSGDYTKVLSQDPVEGFAFFEESIELSRRFRALKLGRGFLHGFLYENPRCSSSLDPRRIRLGHLRIATSSGARGVHRGLDGAPGGRRTREKGKTAVARPTVSERRPVSRSMASIVDKNRRGRARFSAATPITVVDAPQ